MRVLARSALIILILAGCVGCDQTSKALIRASVPLGHGYTYLGGIFQIIHTENAGAFLSLGDSLPPSSRYAVFVLGVGALTAGILLWSLFGRHLRLPHRLWLAIIAASGIANLMDRVFRGGTVTDFLYVGVGPLHTGIFNIADMMLMLGLSGVLLSRLPLTRVGADAP